MKTTYNYTIKKINERNTICTVSAVGMTTFDLEVPIVSNNYEPEIDPALTAEEKTEIRVEARSEFRKAVKKYMYDYFTGKDTEESSEAVTISPTILALEGQSFVININE